LLLRVYGLGFRSSGLGLRAWSSGLRVQGFRCWMKDTGFGGTVLADRPRTSTINSASESLTHVADLLPLPGVGWIEARTQ